MMSNSSDSSLYFGQEVRIRCLMSDRYQQRAFDANIDPACVKSIALWDGFVVIEDTGRAWWSTNIPRSLQDMLRFSSKLTAKPEYVVLGPNQHYFLRLSDGSVFFEGPLLFTETIRKHLDSKKVELVAFGRTSWFVKYTDGTCEWSNDIPKGLEESLLVEEEEGEEDIKDILILSMGPRDQWFVKFEDGSCKAKIVYEGALLECKEVIEENGEINHVALGSTDAYCVLYTLRNDEEQCSTVETENYSHCNSNLENQDKL
eukprot:TRINITY_DN814_c0_g2_i2.p1 TRINITY_DN814_c0_g2~~TRINITY_DN814_c0_g2_i2.p1  ORF type:complete len:259 (+),score=23.87 TRINITY_DN814_c0_g2_i2:201-977(+)